MSMQASPLLLEHSTTTAILAYPVPSHQGRRATVEWQWRSTAAAAAATVAAAPRISNGFPSSSVYLLAPSPTGIRLQEKNKKRKKKQQANNAKLHATNNDGDFLTGCCCCYPHILPPLQFSPTAATTAATITISVGFPRITGSVRRSSYCRPSPSLFSSHGKSIRGGCQEVCFSRSDGPNSSEKEDSSSSPTTTARAGEAEAGEEVEKSYSSSGSQTAFLSYGDAGGLGNLSLLQTRRFWLGVSVGASVVLGGNLGGVTSAILNLRPQASRTVRADLIFPVRGFKRCLDSSHGFEFIYPTSWVGDQRLLYRAVERAERERSLEPLPPVAGRRPSSPQRGGGAGATSKDPVVAFGPPGTNGELNVSVVVAPVSSGFSLQKIGGPRVAGERILRQFIAPEGSKRAATLLNAEQRVNEDRLYYTLEYTVQGPGFFRHNLAVYATNAGVLYSLNAQTSESTWNEVKGDFFEIANSFKLVV